MRTTLVCPRESCEAHQKEVFWAYDGEGPYTKNYRDSYAWQDDNPVPFNSWHRQSYFAISYKEEDRRFRWGKLCVLREVRYESTAFGEKVGEKVRYRIIWDGVYWVSGVSMLLYVLRRFYRIREWSGPMAVEQVRNVIEKAQPRGHYKPEWWRRVARWWFRFVHYDVYLKALQPAKEFSR